MKGNRLIVSWLALLFSVAAWAEELPMAVVDSISPDPEWYVAPVDPATLRAPMRSAAASCKTDSILTFNIDFVLTEVTAYAYDDAGHTISEIVWTVNADGSRVGKSKKEDLYEGNTQVMTSTYIWDNTISDWIGSAKTEYEFTNGKNTATTVFDWLNGAWSAASKQTYVYDAAGRETQYTTYARNAAGQLEYGQRREKTYNTAGKLILDIQYGSYTNGDWVGLYKYVYDYNAAGTQTLNEYYTCTNGAWVGSSRYYYEFDAAGNKTVEERYSGMTEGVWKGSSKYTAAFNANRKETEHITYKWNTTSKTWQNNTKFTKSYDNSNVTDSAYYTWSNGWVGKNRVSKTYSGTLVASEILWKWNTSTADWVYNSQTATVYTGTKISTQTLSYWDGSAWVNRSQLVNIYVSNRLTEANTKAWRNGAWQDSLRVTHGFNAKGIDTLAITCAWNGTAWTSKDSTTRKVTYTAIGSKDYAIEDVSMKWTSSSNKWTGVSRKTSMYDAWGNEIQSDTYNWENNTGWVNNVRRIYGYKDGNKNLQTLNAYMTWNKTKKVWTGTTKTEKGYDETNRQVKTSTYKWNATRADWEGLSSTEDVYENGIKVTSYSYKWDATIWNWIGMFKYDYTYEGSKIKEQVDSRYNTTSGWYYDTKISNVYDGKGRTIQTTRYAWIDNQWCMTSKSQTTYDADADGGRLREQLTATGSNCVVTSYALQHYMYACDSHFYTIRFVNEDGSLLDSKQEISGNVPSYTGVTPTKQEDAQYTYTFNGWDKEISAVTGNTTYTATYSTSIKSYTITWLSSDNSPIDQTIVEYGVVPTHADPIKANTAEYTYAFTGWDTTPTAVTGDITYKATFSATKNSYTITFKNGEQVLQSTAVEYGEMPNYVGESPTKQGDAENTYTFNGWDKEITSVTGEETYTAIFIGNVNSYLVTFKDEDGATLDSKLWQYGATPSCTEPTKQNNAQYTFTFAGWDKEIASVTAEATYTATYSSTVNTYLITFKNGDETLQSTAVEYGATPAYSGATPIKAADAQYTYTYAGWDKEITAVTGDATYTATFTETLRSYTITWLNSDNSPIDETMVAYGVVPTHADPIKANTAEYTYAFTGWDTTPTAVTGDITYKATFSATKNSYTITFKNGEQVLQSTAVEYGEMPNYNGTTPTKPADAQYTYTFIGWDATLSAVTGEATYTAVFDSALNSYTVTFYYEDGTTVLDQMTLEYGETPSTPYIPSMPSDVHHTYTFSGWSPEIAPVTGNVSYTPTFTAIPNQYTVIFRNYNGRELLRKKVDYGSMPEYDGDEPIRPATNQCTYMFDGWTPELELVSGDATYTAVYVKVMNTYTILFYDEDGTLLDEVVVEHGQKPTTSVIPTKDPDEQYIYTFAGWTPKVTKATTDATYTATYTATKQTEDVPMTNDESPTVKKVMIDGVFYILRGGHTYTIDGILVK